MNIGWILVASSIALLVIAGFMIWKSRKAELSTIDDRVIAAVRAHIGMKPLSVSAAAATAPPTPAAVAPPAVRASPLPGGPPEVSDPQHPALWVVAEQTRLDAQQYAIDQRRAALAEMEAALAKLV